VQRRGLRDVGMDGLDACECLVLPSRSLLNRASSRSPDFQKRWRIAYTCSWRGARGMDAQAWLDRFSPLRLHRWPRIIVAGQLRLRGNLLRARHSGPDLWLVGVLVTSSRVCRMAL
jgi:hypothetical protein